MTGHRLAVPVVLFLGSLAGSGSAGGQNHSPCDIAPASLCTLSAAQTVFLLDSRRATAPYESPAAAYADGYRPIGSDAPAMGRHWVSLGRLFDGKIESARPELLTYALVDGRETLVGIGFAYVVDPDASRPPPPSPFEPSFWHVHSGRLDMESHRMNHAGGGLAGHEAISRGREAGHGVSVLHAWVWVENPAGVLAPNNWTLPYFRVGLARPADATPEADRAMSLASVGSGFFIDRAELFPDPGSAWSPASLRDAETEVREWWRARPPGPLTSTEVEWLGELWAHFSRTIP